MYQVKTKVFATTSKKLLDNKFVEIGSLKVEIMKKNFQVVTSFSFSE